MFIIDKVENRIIATKKVLFSFILFVLCFTEYGFSQAIYSDTIHTCSGRKVICSVQEINQSEVLFYTSQAPNPYMIYKIPFDSICYFFTSDSVFNQRFNSIALEKLLSKNSMISLFKRVDNIEQNLTKFNNQYRYGTSLIITGKIMFYTGFGLAIYEYKKTGDLGIMSISLILLGAVLPDIGSFIQVDSHKYLKNINIRGKGNGLTISVNIN